MQAGWEMRDGKLTRTFELVDFKAAMGFVGKVAELAEAAQHHPDIQINYNKVTLELFTHSAGAVTEKDHALAEKISELV